MTTRPRRLTVLAFTSVGIFSGGPAPARAAAPSEIVVRAGIDPSNWDRLLQRYVDESGLVRYSAWKASREDAAALDAFLKELAAPASNAAVGADRQSALVNAYNALAISWILRNFPTESIRSLPDSFSARRHELGGRRVSLDDIEDDLRKSIGYRVHSAISCASRSCPPLSRSAYRAATLDSRLDEGMRRWLARDDLNHFEPGGGRAEVSMIFKWFAGDFENAKGGLRGVFAAYGPGRFRTFLAGAGYRIEYRPYDWGLNDQGPHGRDYGGIRKLLDAFGK